jgi:DNA-binding PadR family transcriptional regulator
MGGGIILKGHLDLLLLAAVRVGPSHGYQISREVKRRSRGEFDLSEGAVYGALHRLEDEGFLRSRKEIREGRECRVYDLTKKGHRELEEQEISWRRFARAMQWVLEAR